MLKLLKSQNNPVITPETGQGWESRATFNPGAVETNGGIHILYRAVDRHRISRLGYASTSDGVEIATRSATPVLEPAGNWEEFGCEDPRITPMNGSYYVTYTAYSRRGTRLALASTQNFQQFQRYGVVGPDRNDKDCVLFPELVNGKVTLLHRLESEIQIAQFESFEALRNSRHYWGDYLKHFWDYEIIRPKYRWERRKVGAGPPPLRVEEGWLLIYHGVSIEGIYRAGALLLDLNDPMKLIARTTQPILEPEREFERRGVVRNVVFPDGAVIHKGELFVYYGGADRVCCVASAPLDEFLDELKEEPLPS